MNSPWMTRAEAGAYLRWHVRTIDRYLVPASNGKVKGKMRYTLIPTGAAVRIRIVREDVYAICPLPESAHAN